MSDIPTTPPFSGSTTPSTNTPYVQAPNPVVANTNEHENIFRSKEWLIAIIGFIVAGLVGYFTTLISVKQDVASNHEEISIIKNDVANIKSQLTKVEDEMKSQDSMLRDYPVTKSKIESIQKELDEQKIERRESKK